MIEVQQRKELESYFSVRNYWIVKEDKSPVPLTTSRYNEGSEISEPQVVLHISTKDQKFLNSKQLEIEYKTNDQKFVNLVEIQWRIRNFWAPGSYKFSKQLGIESKNKWSEPQVKIQWRIINFQTSKMTWDDFKHLGILTRHDPLEVNSHPLVKTHW